MGFLEEGVGEEAGNVVFDVEGEGADELVGEGLVAGEHRGGEVVGAGRGWLGVLAGDAADSLQEAVEGRGEEGRVGAVGVHADGHAEVLGVLAVLWVHVLIERRYEVLLLLRFQLWRELN